MTKSHERSWPEWAEQERTGDLAWIHENLHIFWSAAQMGYETVGRGAIVVDTTLRPTGGGHPFGYFDQAAIEQWLDEDTKRLVREYDPSWEFIASLLKSQDRLSTYRIGVLPPGSRENLGSRVETSQMEGPPAVPSVEPPDLETLMKWVGAPWNALSESPPKVAGVQGKDSEVKD